MRRLLPVTLLLPLLLLSVSAHALIGGIAVSIGKATNVEGAEIASFSADVQIETEENQMSSRLYHQPGMVRDETSMEGMQMVSIQRYDLGKVWMLMGPGMYMESEVGESQQAPEYELIERTVEGREVVNGMQTTKYKTIYQGPDGRFGGFTWFTDDNIAVKGFMVSETKGEKQRIKWTMTNVQRGDQADSLFELPAGARKMNGMAGLAGMAGAGQPMPTQPGAGAAVSGMPPSAASQSAAGQAQQPAADDPNVAEEIAGEAAQTAGDTAKQETKNSINDSVKRGIGKLFGR